MDYDKLIHCLKCCARVDAQNVGCDDCGLEYCGEECQQLCGTAATAIETLRAALARVTAERDGAVDSIPRNCETCAYHVVFFNGCTPDHDCTNPDGGCSNNYDRWKWRGQKED